LHRSGWEKLRIETSVAVRQSFVSVSRLKINCKEKQEKVMSSQPYRILIVEEASSWAQTVGGILKDNQDSSFHFAHASSLLTGLQKLAIESFDALLLDRGALKYDAPSDVVKLRAQFATLPIIVLLPKKEGAIGKQLLNAGASDYVLKESLSRDLLQKAVRFAVERERKARALQQSEERFQELFENARDIIFTLDLEGNFTSLNKSAVEVMGWSKEEARKINIKNLVAPEHLNLCRQMMQRILNEEPMQQFEISVLRKDGQKVLLETSARLIQSDGKKKGVQGIARDVTERRHLENMVRQSQKMDAIGRLSGGVAHDFNNLLCVISGHAELLSERLEREHPGAKNVAQIKRAVDSASTLVRQLLAFSRKQVFYPQTLNLNTIVIETEKLLGRLIGEHIGFCCSLDPGLGRVRVDPIQIEQVIVNLVLNARDAMPQGGKLMIATSNVDLDEDCRSRRANIPAGKYTVLAVSDNGSGMDEETQNRIFEPFYTTKELGKGTGLGLATVYGIIKQSGGSIWVYSEPGHGTTFKIYLPRVDAIPSDDSSCNQLSENRPGTETILLVENAEPLRALAKEFLRGSGYAVLEAENGKEAIRIAMGFGGPIHLLLTDVIMPEMGGKQLAGQLASLRPATKVLYMSGYSDDGIVQSGILATEMVFLEKPFTRDILLRKVRRILDEVPQLA
jgi:two-component system cell cycle sensor histidine kinase/response regulator CckA